MLLFRAGSLRFSRCRTVFRANVVGKNLPLGSTGQSKALRTSRCLTRFEDFRASLRIIGSSSGRRRVVPRGGSPEEVARTAKRGQEGGPVVGLAASRANIGGKG